MGLLERLHQRLGFTRNEGLIVLFLRGSLLLGGAIKFYKNASGNVSQHFDYSHGDTEFANLLQGVNNEFLATLQADSRVSTAVFNRTYTKFPRVLKLKNLPSKKN